jgi:hypothetical protein
MLGIDEIVSKAGSLSNPRSLPSVKITHSVLALQGANEPPQDLLRSFFLSFTLGDVGEKFRSFTPVS